MSFVESAPSGGPFGDVRNDPSATLEDIMAYALRLEPCRELEEGSNRMCIAASRWIEVPTDHVFVDDCGLQARLARYQSYEFGIGLIGDPDDHLFVELQDRSGWVEHLAHELRVDEAVSGASLRDLVYEDYADRFGTLDTL